MKETIYNVETGETTEREIVGEELQRVLEQQEEEQKEQRINELKQLLQKYKEDVEQVELFGMERTDYEEKKRLCAEMILELRELEGKHNAI